MLMIHTFVMFAISTAHVVVILDYNFTIFLYHNAATEGDVVPSYDGRFLAFVLMLLLNVGAPNDIPTHRRAMN